MDRVFNPKPVDDLAMLHVFSPDAGSSALKRTFNLASLYEAKQDLDAAKKEGLRAVSLDPGSPFALGALGGAQIGRSEYAEARETFEKLARLHPSQASGWQGLIVTLLELKDVGGERQASERGTRAVQQSKQNEVPPAAVFRIQNPHPLWNDSAAAGRHRRFPSHALAGFAIPQATKPVKTVKSAATNFSLVHSGLLWSAALQPSAQLVGENFIDNGTMFREYAFDFVRTAIEENHPVA